jgi:hypothetical protein
MTRQSVLAVSDPATIRNELQQSSKDPLDR